MAHITLPQVKVGELRFSREAVSARPRSWTLVRQVVLKLVLMLCGATPAAGGSIPAIHFDPAEGHFDGDTWSFGDRGWANAETYEVRFPRAPEVATYGWSLQLIAPAVLTHLAVFDEGGDGLEASFQVGLWGTSQEITALIPAGDAAPLRGQWRLAPVGPLLLEPGSYDLGAAPTELTDDTVFFWNFDIVGGADSSKIPFDPRVHVDNSLPSLTIGSGFGRPDLSFLVTGAYVGPNAFFAPVPEPSSAVLVTMAAWALLGIVESRGHRSLH